MCIHLNRLYIQYKSKINNNVEDNEIKIIDKLKNKGVLDKNVKCVCGDQLQLYKRKRDKQNKPILTYRCKNYKCQRYRSIYKDTFFQLFRKSLMFIYSVIQFWCIQLSIAKSTDLIKLENLDCDSNETINRKTIGRLRNII
jgi:hypothetical protein